VNWYLAVLKNYAGFNGRAGRSEFWMFFLINLVIVVVLEIIGALIKTQIIYYLYALAVLIPYLAVSFRRLHDTGRSAWWLLIGLIPIVGAIVLIVFCAMPGQQGSNQYGPEPSSAPATS
jgi:uncharacterized membrane protein YhaH (DUF805 family)